MIEPHQPANEAERLQALLDYGVLDTEAEQAYDDLTRIASDICGTPIALVSLVDAERQWFKSKVGLGACETPRNVAFCSHAILDPDEILVVPDSLADERFHDNPLAIEEPHVRFYAGAPLVNSEGLAMGTLCVIDHQPRNLSAAQLETLRALARQVVSQLELRRTNASLNELAQQLGRSNEELKQFTSIAAHDLQEPLRKLIAFSELLEEDLGEDLPAAAAEDLGYIANSSRRMQLLVSDLLKLSRAGSSEVELGRVEVSDCVALAIDALSLRISEAGAKVVVDPLPAVRGDAGLLTQVFQNLIGNAVKFVKGRQPEVRVTCSTADDELVIGVQDNGIGMDPAQIDKIFDPFKRLHGRDQFEGTGIGLAITRKIVERHGGRIWAESCPGEGSHFKFTLKSSVAAAV